MKRYLVYENLDRVANFLVNNGHRFRHENCFPRNFITFDATEKYITDMKEELAIEEVYPVFHEFTLKDKGENCSTTIKEEEI
jgi:hypothetical protein